jgi:hypothetical protein
MEERIFISEEYKPMEGSSEKVQSTIQLGVKLKIYNLNEQVTAVASGNSFCQL